MRSVHTTFLVGEQVSKAKFEEKMNEWSKKGGFLRMENLCCWELPGLVEHR
jgi:hypothetical protein